MKEFNSMENKPQNNPIENPVISTLTSSQTPVEKPKGLKLTLPVAILVSAILISASVLYSKPSTTGTAAIGDKAQIRFDVSVDDDSYMGDKSAPVVMIEFSDYQCPFCRKFWTDTLSQLKKEYIDTGKVLFVYRDFPLDIHPASHISAEAAECSKEQNKYWEYHDKMFIEQNKQGANTVTYGAVELKKWAREIGMDSNKFNQCLDTHKYKSEIEKDIQDGTKVQVSGTPTFFINGRSIVGSQPFNSFKAIIEEELKAGPKKHSFFKI